MGDSRTEYFTPVEEVREAMRLYLPMAHAVADELRALLATMDAKEFETRLLHLAEVTRTLDRAASAHLRSLQDRPINLHELDDAAQNLRDYDLPDSY